MPKSVKKSPRPLPKHLPQHTAQADSDRSWIKPPNTISNQGSGDSPQKLSYWTDQNGEVKLYTREQLATCNILTNMDFLLVKALVLIDTLQTIDKNATVGSLIEQDYVKISNTKSSAFNHFIELMAAVPDITFGEFLGYISPNSNPQEFLKLGQKKLKAVMDGQSEDVSIFYGSDRVKKS